MVHAPLQNRRSGMLLAVVRLAAVAGLLLACAVLLVSSTTRQVRILRAAELDDTLFTVCLVAPIMIAGVLAVLLWRARLRIGGLVRDRDAVIDKAGLDPLTGLPDRLCFERALERAMRRRGPGTSVALVAIDVDRFKSVNDTYGHQAGDRLLLGLVNRVAPMLRKGDCFARMGGDEFALMLCDADEPGRCSAAAQRVLDAMIAPLDLGPAQVYATLSLGIAVAPRDGDSVETLCQAADLALYQAKHEGRNRFAIFDKSMGRKLHLGRTVEDDLRRAIDNNELSIAFQPLVRARDGVMQGVEALVRWDHPRLGTVPPEDFIPLAESRGLIVPLGEWVLRRACLDAKRWPTLRLAVNVSPVQFRQRDFVDRVAAILAVTGTDPCRVDLELTEGVLIQDAEQAETVIMELRALGIRMGLDDFGSGYSSMIYLRRFAFDKVKIDRAFLQSLESSGEGAIILEYIVSLGHALGLSVTAEGVEQVEQVEFLRKLGCDELQGYYFAPPLTAAEVDERLSVAAWTTAASETPSAAVDANPKRDAA